MEKIKYKPVISVIVPVYNTGQNLRYLVDSVIAQTFKDYELLLIDDGSTDEVTSKICDEYGKEDSRVKVIHQVNGGVSSARNTGLVNALGTFIAFVDSDDYLFPDYLQTMLEEAQIIGGDTYDLVISEFIKCKREDIDKCNNNRQKNTELSAKNIQEMPNAVKKMGYRNFVVWNQLFKKELIVQHHIRFIKTNSEDEMFATEYFTHVKSFKENNYKGYVYIENPNSLGSSHKYIASYPWIVKMESLYDIIIKQHGLYGKYLDTYNWRIADRLAVLCIKGYHKDSHMSWKERMKVWRSVRNDKWLKERIELSMMDIKRRTVLNIARFRLYYILDPVFQIYVWYQDK